MFYNDATRFRQVFVNLINNAYKYTENGSIKFGYKKKNTDIIFFVKDTGIGIAESEYENIFSSFNKIDKGENQLYRGAGIGLSISNRLVEIMGGKMWLNSKIGEGTTFFFTFSNHPAKDGVKANLSKKSKNITIENPSLENRTIIVAEDETANYILIERILQKTKVNILWAKNGLEALKMVKEQEDKDVFLVLMDIKMPEMNGIRAAELIRQYNDNLPIIAVTAYAQEQNREEILQHNFIDYIAKPFKAQKLLDMVYHYAKVNKN